MSVKLDSKIFNKLERERELGNFISRQAKEFKQLTKDNMSFSEPTGIVYSVGRGESFRRYHRASRAGERPAPDTNTLVNAISDRKVGDLSVEVYIADKINPRSGTIASDYGAIIQTKLDRPIMSESDVAEAQLKANAEAQILVSSLTD